MANLFVKHYSIGPEWAGGAGERRYMLEMDEYEFANLRWLMNAIWIGTAAGQNLDTGDWCGQIRHALVDGASRLGRELKPNVGESPKALERGS